LEGIRQTLPDLAQAIEEAQAQVAERDKELGESKSKTTVGQQELKRLAAASDQANLQLRKLMNELGSLEGKIKGLAATLDSNEGLTVGSRAVMEMASAGMLRGSYLPVGQALTVTPELALAIETALGGAVHDLIVPDEGDAKAAIALLKEKRLGRATFQPLTLVKGGWSNDDLHRLKRERGVVGIASELVDCDPSHRQVVESLLGRVLVVDDLDAGLRLPRNRAWNRLVTLEGEVINSSGSVTGGAHRHQGYGMIQRKAELAELEARAGQLQSQLKAGQKAISQNEASQRLVQSQLEAVSSEIKERSRELDEAKSWLASLTHEKQGTERSLARLESEKGQLKQPIETPSEPMPDLEQAQVERDQIMQALAARQADVQASLQRRQELDARTAQAAARVRECRRRLAHLQEADSLRSRRSGGIQEDRERLKAALAEAQGDLVKRQEEALTRTGEVDLAVKGRKLLVEETSRLAEEVRKAHEASAAFSATLHQVELAKAKAEGRKNAAIERLLEEYGLLPDEVSQEDLQASQTGEAPQRVHALRREIKSLGDVNLGAIEAFDRLSERSRELTLQVEDIETGRAEIEAGIKELDRLTRERFLATFSLLKDEFSRMFGRIFNGGEGSLELEEGENILDAGVEIAVTIPGKKRQRLELLSGGERALSALAFLFSLLKVKPSPLVILDEVDAPLDGRNVERFIAMMREMAEEMQFILITHNTLTIESADVWFGVTMQEPGVSTVVPFKAPPFARTQASLKG
jgi:chromosome segregation protein